MAMGFVFEHVLQLISKKHYITGGVESVPLVIRDVAQALPEPPPDIDWKSWPAY